MNSTNPGSQLGKWWAAQIPQGKTADYRSDNNICYQWSPLDKMTQCSISAGTKVAIGPGQSAACPGGYVTYPASAEKQIYIANAPEVVIDCVTFDDQFNWHQVQPSE